MGNVLMISSEVAPFAKTGGLGDVVGALPQALVELGDDVRVIMPKYGCIAERYKEKMEFKFFIYVPLGWRRKYCGVFELKKDGVTYYFIDNEYYFGDCYIYKWNDLERFAFFDKAALEVLLNIGFKPDIIHCHDWQTGMVPALLDAYYRNLDFYKDIKTIFTIHNLRYQGIYEIDTVAEMFSLSREYFTSDKLEFHGCANLLKAGLVYSQFITTVSPSYSEEIKTPVGGEKLDGILRARKKSLFGILNGIDYKIFNPRSDEFIYENYTVNNVIEGKRINKIELQKQLGLPVDAEKAVIGIVARLVDQKGIDLIAEAMAALVDMDIQIIIAGTGEEKYENLFKHNAWCNPNKVSANISFDNEFAHKVYASCDIFLMPSLYEPCGLSQLIALAYGVIPIVRETGGLRDTITPYNECTDEGNGFSFANYSAHDMIYTIRRALSFYSDKKIWNRLVKKAMEQDFSWKESAVKYRELYGKLVDKF